VLYTLLSCVAQLISLSLAASHYTWVGLGTTFGTVRGSHPTLFETDCEIHVQVLLSAHETDGLTSPPKDEVSRESGSIDHI
jgi:hypothetical protein